MNRKTMDRRQLLQGLMKGALLGGAAAPLGLLGIELHTRRRNRLNGVVRGAGTQGFSVEVTQSFGNCPQYIQGRDKIGRASCRERVSSPV